MYAIKKVPTNKNVASELATKIVTLFALPESAKAKSPTNSKTWKAIKTVTKRIICTNVALPVLTPTLRIRKLKYENPDTPALGKTWFTKLSSSIILYSDL